MNEFPHSLTKLSPHLAGAAANCRRTLFSPPLYLYHIVAARAGCSDWKTLSAEHTFDLDCSQSEGSLSSCWIIVASQSWLSEKSTSFKPGVRGGKRSWKKEEQGRWCERCTNMLGTWSLLRWTTRSFRLRWISGQWWEKEEIFKKRAEEEEMMEEKNWKCLKEKR